MVALYLVNLNTWDSQAARRPALYTMRTWFSGSRRTMTLIALLPHLVVAGKKSNTLNVLQSLFLENITPTIMLCARTSRCCSLHFKFLQEHRREWILQPLCFISKDSLPFPPFPFLPDSIRSTFCALLDSIQI